MRMRLICEYSTGDGSARAGAIQAFGQALNAHYDFSGARVVLSLDADFLFTGPGSVFGDMGEVSRAREGAQRAKLRTSLLGDRLLDRLAVRKARSASVLESSVRTTGIRSE